MQTFFLAMVLHPEVQRKAQAQLETVVGPHRLPEFEDQKNLPYIHAIVKECLRWQNVFTLGLPHRLMEDDEYNGYHLPKGSIVLGNIWYAATFATSRSTTMLKNNHLGPYRMIPRHIPIPRFSTLTATSNLMAHQTPTSSTQPYSRLASGGGMYRNHLWYHIMLTQVGFCRACPGRHFAIASIYIYVASILHVYNIRAKQDKDGKPVKIRPDMVSGVVSYVSFLQLQVSTVAS